MDPETRPVIVYYPPNLDHPNAGQSFECPSEDVAREHHPHATILESAAGQHDDAPQTPAAAV